jgi:hypothetical protein
MSLFISKMYWLSSGSETYNMLVAVASDVAVVGIGVLIVDLIVEVRDVDSRVAWCACGCVCVEILENVGVIEWKKAKCERHLAKYGVVMSAPSDRPPRIAL